MQPRIERRRCRDATSLPVALHPVSRRVLAARGLTKPADLDFSLAALAPVERLGGLPQAVEVLAAALRRGAHIVVVGDFDADGATSSAVALRALRAFGAEHTSYLVPNRFEYGYGLTPPIVELAEHRDADVLVTVDNGISSLAGVEAARRAAMQVVITDHHLPGASLPLADAIVDPNLPNDDFPSKALAGVGVIFYVMMALRRHLRDQGWFAERGIEEPNLASLLDLVALGTVADVVPLDHNNRRLVAQGLARIRAGRCHAGITALLEVAGRGAAPVTAQDLAFALAPRLNAAGRMADMSLGIACLLTDDLSAAREHARQLDALNRERRLTEKAMRTQAVAIVENLELDAASQLPAGLSLFDPRWHQGVIGVVASRIKDQYHRPVVAFARAGNDELKGSVRSIAGVHARDVLDTIATTHPEVLARFGGHAMAAGLSLTEGHLDLFSTLFAAEVEKLVAPDQLSRVIVSDGELAAAEMTKELAQELKYIMPWGHACPEPLFDGRFDICARRRVGETHVKLRLRPHDGQQAIDAIAFDAASAPWAMNDAPIHAVFRLDVNYYRGSESLQLVIDHAEPLA